MSSWMLILAGGVVATALMYYPPGLEFRRAGDDYGVAVTLCAAVATLFLFAGLAAITHGFETGRMMQERRMATSALSDERMNALVTELEANIQSPSLP